MIVGIGSAMRVGKDTGAQALCRDLAFRRIGFADKLKELAYESDPPILANMTTNVGIGHGNLKYLVSGAGGWERAKSQFPAVRKFLQTLGVAGRKVFGEDFWIDQALAGVGLSENVVVADVRFLNEFDAIRARGGRLIKINRPGHVGSGHVSETELSDPLIGWDAVVDNNGSIVDLEAKIVGLVTGWLAEEKSKTLGLDFEIKPVPDTGIVAGVGSESRVEH